MKPLWNAPSLGTLRSRQTQAFVFLLVALDPLIFIPLLMLSPLVAVVRAASQKKPHRIWRTLTVVSIVLAFLLGLPRSPLFVGFDFPFRLAQNPTTDDEITSILRLLLPYVNAALSAEVALLPLAIAATLHTARSRQRGSV